MSFSSYFLYLKNLKNAARAFQVSAPLYELIINSDTFTIDIGKKVKDIHLKSIQDYLKLANEIETHNIMIIGEHMIANNTIDDEYMDYIVLNYLEYLMLGSNEHNIYAIIDSDIFKFFWCYRVRFKLEYILYREDDEIKWFQFYSIKNIINGPVYVDYGDPIIRKPIKDVNKFVSYIQSLPLREVKYVPILGLETYADEFLWHNNFCAEQ